jgi:hypothetical protein
MMRASIRTAETRFSADRMLRSYEELMYRPALADLFG